MKPKNKKGNSPSSAVPVKKKKKHTGVILLVLVLVLLAGAAVGYYFYERQKPQKATEAFMQSIQTLDFDSMTSMIQTEDLSVLDGTDIRNSAYTDFFRSMCEKITYSIVKTRFSLTDGTADVTVRINYADGSDIYKQASSEFLRKIAAASFSGKNVSEEELKQSLAETLIEARDNSSDSFLVTEVTYPMISINGEWKVTSLDPETIKVMSSNFNTVEEEFEASLDAAQNGKSVSMQAPVGTGDLIDMETDHFKIHYTQFRLTKDISGKSCLLVYYEYTNKSGSSSCPMIDVSLQAFQNSISLEAAIPETTENALDLYMSEVAPQQTITVCQAFSLTDTSDVTLTASDAFAFGGGEASSQLLKLQ